MKEEKICEKVNKVKSKDKLNLFKEQLALEKEKALRAQAEMLNYRKRKDDEVSQLFKYANEELIISLLPIVDNFERAIKLDDNDLTDELSKFLNGFKMIYGNLITVLNNNEVVEIDAQGQEFNPNMHQAIITEKDENKPAGVILEVLQKGYKYKEKVIRPAMVKVNE
ncbi:MAG: nucleotide exchange factor GrpE [Bacilli bacterium]|nr:nucleotide exchange factor GrpE [Bacilli bacterium]MDD4406759.1 nucleotide exchange factor GrpE [Bacilli bacterium]